MVHCPYGMRPLCANLAGIAQVHDTGISPHTPVRLWLRGRLRRCRVRVLCTPPKAEAMLPAGCLPEQAADGWDDIAPDGQAVNSPDEDFGRWICRVEQQVATIKSFDDEATAKFQCRSGGAKFKMICPLGAPSSGGCKLSAITQAWKCVASWLTDIAVGAGPCASAHAQAKAKRSAWLIAATRWEALGDGIHARAFKQWVRKILPSDLCCRVQLNWLRATARAIAGKAAAHDAACSRMAWDKWINEGPAASLGRHHRMTRTRTGWIPSSVSKVNHGGDDSDEAQHLDADDHGHDTEVDEDDLVHAELLPLSSQEEVEAAAVEWGAQWRSDVQPQPLPWPDLSRQSSLPALTAQVDIKAAQTFPSRTGLGWDKLHPRAVCRCHSKALDALVRLLIVIEVVGSWPQAIGATLICLIPKPDGGRRPIGLLPSIIRWWMRMRLDVVRVWQSQHERPFFYAGPRKGAEVASWKQAATSELAMASHKLSYASVLLDMIKCFERVPHHVLLYMGERFQYPLLVLRLSIAAYRLARSVVVDGLCSALLVASRGITAGAVHATIELRLLLVEVMSRADLVPYTSIYLYVDDATFDAIGPSPVVEQAVVQAVRIFTEGMQELEMEFSDTKNVCIASSPDLARAIAARLPGLGIKVRRSAKSLGAPVSGGKVRNVEVQRKRLAAFKVRKTLFRKLRRWVGASRTHRVIRTGGAAALVYGGATMGVSNTMLAAQRSAVAMAAVAHGSSDVDIALALADGSVHGRADPAFQAHAGPIGKWAEAVWEAWLPRQALYRLAVAACIITGRPNFSWRRVRGPAAAFVASAERLGWEVVDAFNLVTDLGIRLSLTVDSPAHVVELVHESVRRWRWRRVEAKLPYLEQGDGGHGPFIEPIYKLLRARGTAEWTAKQQGALRSAMANRQWCQLRLFNAGRVQSKNCRLCVLYGFCDEMDPHPRHTGHEVHRLYTCPVTEPFRRLNAPDWLLREVASKLDSSGMIDSPELAFYTRALSRHPRPRIAQFAADDEGFMEWIVRPEGGVFSGEVFVDGSRLYAEHRLFDLCTSIGYAIAAFDEHRNLTALARGRPPSWIRGIYGAELFALMQAAVSAFAVTAYRTDCQSVHTGCRNGQAWANAPARRFARAWGPLITALEGQSDLVTWMPAHCSAAQTLQAARERSMRQLSDGTQLSRHLVLANGLVDRHAKIAAAVRRPPPTDTQLIQNEADRVVSVAMWIGKATEAANHWPAPHPEVPPATVRFVRDSEAMAVKRKPSATAPSPLLPAAAAQLPPVAVVQTTTATPCQTAIRIGRKAAGDWSTASHARAAMRCRVAARAEADAQALRLQDWVEAQPTLAPPPVSAQQRIAAMRERLAAKRRMCGCCLVLGPPCQCNSENRRHR